MSDGVCSASTSSRTSEAAAHAATHGRAAGHVDERPDRVATRIRGVEGGDVQAVPVERGPRERRLAQLLDGAACEPRRRPRLRCAQAAAPVEEGAARAGEQEREHDRCRRGHEARGDIQRRPEVGVQQRHESVAQRRRHPGAVGARHRVVDRPLIEPRQRARGDKDAEDRERSSRAQRQGEATPGHARAARRARPRSAPASSRSARRRARSGDARARRRRRFASARARSWDGRDMCHGRSSGRW